MHSPHTHKRAQNTIAHKQKTKHTPPATTTRHMIMRHTKHTSHVREIAAVLCVVHAIQQIEIALRRRVADVGVVRRSQMHHRFVNRVRGLVGKDTRRHYVRERRGEGCVSGGGGWEHRGNVGISWEHGSV